MERSRWTPCLALALVAFAATLHGQQDGKPSGDGTRQSSAQTSEGGSGVTTLHAGAHLVVLDVVVTDKKGRTVSGLGKDVFQVLEDGQPQTVKFFEEHAPVDPALVAKQKAELAARLPVNTFTNYEPFTGIPATILLMNEVGALPQFDYAPLYMRMMALVHDAPPETPFVVYEVDSQLRLSLPLTTDREAVGRTVERLWSEAHFALDVNASEAEIMDRRKVFLSAMQQLSSSFATTPERKTIFAFTGGLQCALGTPKQNCVDPLPPRAAADLKAYLCGVMDVLEQGRFSIYRYYPSGQIIYGFGCVDAAADLRHVFDTNSHYYTLYYTPTDADWNGRYRNFKVKLADKNLHASYRPGYYATPENAVAGHYAAATDVRGLLASAGREMKGAATSEGTEGDAESNGDSTLAPNPLPVVFTVQVVPAAAPGTGPQVTPPAPGNSESEADRVQGYRDYTLRFTVAAAGLRIARELKVGQALAYTARIQIAAVSYVQGHPADAKTSQFTATFDGPSDPRIANGAITASLTIQVPEKGERLLHVIVRDVHSRQEGMLDIPVEKIVLPAR